MATVSTIHTNGTSGELSPLLDGRTDIQKYFNGYKIVENFISTPHGAMRKRGGSQFIANTKTNSKARLIDFVFSETQAYVLEFTNNNIRIFKDRGQITSVGVPVDIISTYLESELFDLQYAQSADVMYIVHQNHLPKKLSRQSDTTWTLVDAPIIKGAYLDVNATAITLTPSATTGIGITVTASAALFTANDVGRLIKIGTGELRVFSFTSTTVVVGDVLTTLPAVTPTLVWNLGEWYPTNAPGSIAFFEQRLVYGGSPAKPQTVWFSKIADFDNFDAGTGLDDEAMTYTIATDKVNPVQWLSPGKVLVIGTSGGEFIASASSTNQSLTPTNVRIVRQTNHGTIRVLPQRVANSLLFIQRAKRKVLEFIYQFETDSFVSPDKTILSEHITSTGIVDNAYQAEPESIIWYVLTNGQLVSLTFLKEQDVTAWNKHIIGGVSDSAGTNAIVESVASIPADGRDEVYISVKRFINGVTTRSVEVVTQGLNDTESQEQSFFVDSGLTLDNPFIITAISKSDPAVVTTSLAHGFLNGDEVKIRDVVGMTEVNNKKFTISGVTGTTFQLSGTDSTAFNTYVSNGTVRESVLTISGLSHLEGETVDILADGGVTPQKVVTAGAVTLDSSASIVHVGLPYLARIRTMSVEAGSQLGTSQGITKRIIDITIRVYNTLGLRAGGVGFLDIIDFRKKTDLMDNAVPLFTGDVEVDSKAGYEKKGRIDIESFQPLPATILAVILRLTTNER